MTDSAIYIPTRRRARYLDRAIDALCEITDLPIYVVAEPDEADDLQHALLGDGITPIWLPVSGRGIGYSRNRIVQHAKRQGFTTIAMVDDDQIVKGDIDGLLKLAAREDVVGIGAWNSIYGLYMRGTNLGDTRGREPGVWLHSGSMGYQTWALNMANFLSVGGMDPSLRYGEDAECARRAYVHFGVPWYIYTGVTTNAMLKHNPGPEFGGLTEADRTDGEHAMHVRVAIRYPGYVSPVDKKFRCYWRKMAEEQLPVGGQWPLENIRTEEPFDWEVEEDGTTEP